MEFVGIFWKNWASEWKAYLPKTSTHCVANCLEDTSPVLLWYNDPIQILLNLTKWKIGLIGNFHFFAWHMAATFNDFLRETLQGIQYRKKNWQTPKNRVENRRNTNTAFMIGHAYPSRMFVSMSQASMHQQSTSAIVRKRKITSLSLQRSKSLVVVLVVCNNNFI